MSVPNPFLPAAIESEPYTKKGVPTCGANKPGGGLCGTSAGSRTDHPGYGRCDKHGGNSPTGVKAAHTAELEAYVRHNLGAPVYIDAIDAMTLSLAICNGHVQWLARQVGEFEVNPNVAKRGPQRMGDTGDVNLAPLLSDAQREVYGIYLTERRLLFDMSATAVRLGIAARQVELAEKQGSMLALLIDKLLDALELTDDQRAKTATVVPMILREIASTK